MRKSARAGAPVPSERHFDVADDRRALRTVDTGNGEQRLASRVALARLFKGKFHSLIRLAAEFVYDVIRHHKRIVFRKIDRIQLEFDGHVGERHVIRIACRERVIVDSVAAEFGKPEFIVSAENDVVARVHIVARQEILRGFFGCRSNFGNAHSARQTVCEPYDHIRRFARLHIAEIVQAFLRAFDALDPAFRFGRKVDRHRAVFRIVLAGSRNFKHQHAVFVEIEAPGIQRTFRRSGALPRFVGCVLRRIGEIVVVEIDRNVCSVLDRFDCFARFRFDLNRHIGGTCIGIDAPQPQRHARRTAVVPADVVYKVQADLPAITRRGVQVEFDGEVVQTPTCRTQNVVLHEPGVCPRRNAESIAVCIDRRMQDQLVAFFQIVDLIRPIGRINVKRVGKRVRRALRRRSAGERQAPSECRGEQNACHKHTCQNEDTLLFSHHFPFTSK